MGDQQKAPSTSWAISGGLSLSGGGKVGGSHMGMTLFDVNAQIYFPLHLKVLSIGGGIPLNLTLSTFSPSFFTTSKPLWVKDFSKSGLFANAELCVLIGGGLAYLTFRGIDHDPYWLDVGGLEAGLAAGISGGLFDATAYEKEGKANDGCLISPGGDPLCGGASKSENQSKDTGMSRAN
jgi:hypothetical protein